MRDVKFMHAVKAVIDGVDVIAVRQGMTGEIGFQFQYPKECASRVWNALLKVGDEISIRQLGDRTAMINHLERDGWLEGYGQIAGSFESDDFADWYRSPVDFGWNNRINFDHDFLSADALREELASPRRTEGTLVWNAYDVVGVYAELFRKGESLPDFIELPQEPRGHVHADQILENGKLIGFTSSRGYNDYFREMISLSVIDIEH